MQEQFKKGLSMGNFYAWLESVPKKGLSKYGELVGPCHEHYHTTDFRTEYELGTAIELYWTKQETINGTLLSRDAGK